MINGYKPGDDITIMNVMYQYPKKDINNKWNNDILTIVYKDNNTGVKKHQDINRPDYEFYEIKKDAVRDYPQFFVNKEDTIKHSVKYVDLEKEIAIMTNNLNEFNSNIKLGNRYENKRLHAHPMIANSDMNIEDHYRFRFNNLYKNNICKIDKGYFDIEVDGKYQKGDFPESGECPVNCASYLDDKTQTIYTYILRNSENPLIEQFEKSLNSDFFKKLKDFVIDTVGGIKQAIRYDIDKFNYKLFFFDSEIDMLKTIFNTFHSIDPDFILAWNMAFDIPYIIDRIIELGYNPEDVMCNKSFDNKVASYFIDTRNANNPEEKTDYCVISGNITFLDQLIQFTSRRKGRLGPFPNFKLDTIGEKIAKVKKLDYSHITHSVIELPWLDFETFVLYNIMDVIVQKCIEKKSQDIDYIFAKCIVNNSSYRKGHRQTIYLANRITKDFAENGYIIGNNTNRWNEKPEKFPGALVGDPLKTNSYAKLLINGVPSMIADNMVDYDYKSLYPSVALENNIAPNTLIGSIEIDEKIYENENAWKNNVLRREGEFIENMICDNIIEFCKRYYRFAGFKEFLLEDLVEYSNNYFLNKPLQNFGYIISKVPSKRQAISFRDMDKISPIIFNPSPLDYQKYINDLKRSTRLC